ncbi:ARMC6 protein, partial [Probosciger aterrimus]|nr:ARMC6 protein [Probosciger aterrimus]
FFLSGVDLSNIVKAVRPPASENGQKQKHEILLTLDALGKAVADSDLAEVAEQLVVFTAQCKEQLAFRCLAGQNGAYPVVFSACQMASGDRNLMLKAFYTLSALLDGQPDLLDSAGQDLLLQTLQEYKEDADMALAGIRCVRHACLKHEQNRQDFVKGGILPLLTGAILLGMLWLAVRRLQNSLCSFLTHLCGWKQDVVKQVLSAIRAVAGNDDVKDAIVSAGATDLIVLAISHHLANPQICEQGCAALCMLALRKPENCSIIMEGGGALAALQAMKAHPREVAVQ